MSKNIEGKIVVITGASSGLGEATAGSSPLKAQSVVLGARRRRSSSVISRRVDRQWRQGTRHNYRCHQLRRGEEIG